MSCIACHRQSLRENVESTFVFLKFNAASLSMGAMCNFSEKMYFMPSLN